MVIERGFWKALFSNICDFRQQFAAPPNKVVNGGIPSWQAGKKSSEDSPHHSSQMKNNHQNGIDNRLSNGDPVDQVTTVNGDKETKLVNGDGETVVNGKEPYPCGKQALEIKDGHNEEQEQVIR